MKKEQKKKFAKFETSKLTVASTADTKGGFLHFSGKTGSCDCVPDPSDPDRMF